MLACLEAGAPAAGCTMRHRVERPGLRRHARQRGRWSALYAANAARLGRRSPTRTATPAVVGSTDMGNVSYLVPSIHPMIEVAPVGRADPHPEFAGYAGGPDGDRAVLDGAKALAMTVADLWLRRGAPAVQAELAATSSPTADRPDAAPVSGRSPGTAGPAASMTPVTVYVAEEFTPDEADVLRRYFTNLDGPVFALVNLPEVVKGALFARYSRSPKSLRRLFLDEFVGDLDITGDLTIDATVGLRRAEELYDRVFFEYGDDSVAQLGGVHLACEQASNLLTKVLEWGRLMAYLEQSTRYIAYDARLGGRYRYYRDPAVLELAARHPLRRRHGRAVRHLRRAAARCCIDCVRERVPEGPGRLRLRLPADDQGQGVRRGARASCPRRRCRTSASTAPGQGYEALLLRMRAHPLPEARAYADLMLARAAQGDPVVPHAGSTCPTAAAAWSDLPRSDPRRRPTSVADAALRRRRRRRAAADVTLRRLRPRRRGQAARRDLLPAHAPARGPAARRGSGALPPTSGSRSMRAYVGERGNRRHKPGRAFERIDYRFDVLADYGAFRDLQRHRMLTIEWQPLTPAPRLRRGPRPVDEAGARRASTTRWSVRPRSTTRWPTASPTRPPYAVSLAYRMRFVMQMNAREAMHLIELRTVAAGPPGVPARRQEMHRLIAEQAGHQAVAGRDELSHADAALERLDAERRAEARRLVQPST